MIKPRDYHEEIAREERHKREAAAWEKWAEAPPPEEPARIRDDDPSVDAVRSWLKKEPDTSDPGYLPVDAPLRVAVQREGEEELRVLRAWYEQGKLKRSDLVNPGDGWQPVEQCPLFSTLTYAVQDRERRRARWIYALVVLGCLLLARLLIL